MTIEKHRQAVGARIATIRAERGLSLSELARRARIGKGSLSEIEAGQRNPTLDTLYAIAGPLGVPLTALLGEESGTEGSGEFLRAQILHVEHHPDGATTEVFWLRVLPGGTRTSPAHGPGVVENVLVVTGELVAGRAGAERHAGAGQTLQWISDADHTYTSTAGATAVLTIHSPG
ncbi:helix-turn-helix domain-containing protein [Gordonia rhizosphera]|uniref:Putative transcriptional regulator n=1 Tax=Gordonia rhizosphera NBRC 16068 TaxID=1108045 RepID=K6W9R2_9ACTN|nr:helix-turn-helix transcriptional regulator [Gordonia rhizosphera]GAB88947.1 putative transcriptional regulator [Gordonia rhizosphera NBRC 16068]